MKVEEFIEFYSTEYMFVFHKKKKPTPLSERISNFLFDPIYKVDNLKFETVG